MSEPKLEAPTEDALYAERLTWYRAAGLTAEDFTARLQREQTARLIALSTTPAATCAQEQAA